MGTYEKFVSERLAQLRYNTGVSCREMSLALGQNSSYINRIENGVSMPSFQMFFEICEYMKITPAEFFSSSENPYAVKDVEEKLNKLSTEELDLLLKLVDHFIDLRKENSRDK